MFTEARVSWIVLFLLTASAAVKQYETLGYVSLPMVFMLLAHGLYTNAIMKGEECIPTTWYIIVILISNVIIGIYFMKNGDGCSFTGMS